MLTFVLIHTEILVMCTHFGDLSHSTLAQGAKLSRQDPAVTCTRMSPQGSLGSSHTPKSLVLRG